MHVQSTGSTSPNRHKQRINCVRVTIVNRCYIQEKGPTKRVRDRESRNIIMINAIIVNPNLFPARHSDHMVKMLQMFAQIDLGALNSRSR